MHGGFGLGQLVVTVAELATVNPNAPIIVRVAPHLPNANR
jgi:hypothetical protein